MPGLERDLPGFANRQFRVTPDQLDRYETYQVTYPTTSATWFGTTTVGTALTARALVLINRTADYPRNLAASVTGSADIGGTFVVNGYDFYGNVISETLTIGTTANGGTTAGTNVFAVVTSGTFNLNATSVGNGTPRLGVDTIGTTVKFGLPARIAGSADVKAITWLANGTNTTVNGGTIGALSDKHFFRGTANVAATDIYVVLYKPTYNASSDNNYQANL